MTTEITRWAAEGAWRIPTHVRFRQAAETCDYSVRLVEVLDSAPTARILGTSR